MFGKNNLITVTLFKRENGKYGNSTIEVLKPFKPKLDAKLDSIDGIMFQLMTMQMIKDGIYNNDVKSFEELLSKMMQCKVKLKLRAVNNE